MGKLNIQVICNKSNQALALRWLLNKYGSTELCFLELKHFNLNDFFLKVLFRLEVKDKTFTKTGDIKIKCTATIHTIYWRSNEESIQGKSQQRDKGYFGYDTRGFWNSGMAIMLKFWRIFSSSPLVNLKKVRKGVRHTFAFAHHDLIICIQFNDALK